jgi:hypothetical protein
MAKSAKTNQEQEQEQGVRSKEQRSKRSKRSKEGVVKEIDKKPYVLDTKFDFDSLPKI